MNDFPDPDQVTGEMSVDYLNQILRTHSTAIVDLDRRIKTLKTLLETMLETQKLLGERQETLASQITTIAENMDVLASTINRFAARKAGVEIEEPVN
jgi:hypothetical protein